MLPYDAVSSQSSVNLFTNKDLGLTLEYPSDWMLNEQLSNYDKAFSSQLFFVPEEKTNEETFISFSVLGVGNYTLDEYSAFSNDLQMNNRNVEDIANGITSNNLGNIDTPTLNLTYIAEDELRNKFYIQEISAISKKTLFTVTLITPEETATQLASIFKNFVSSIIVA